ncbi:MAG: HAD-IA family hydrolase [Clostridia bacterium]|nr:HAD-IA family hydrolase [Clostridia bacterium]
MNIKAVIFDMDGVLVDSESVITKAAMLALKEWGIDSREEDFKPFTGMGENSFIGGVARKYGVSFSLDMKVRTYEIYVSIVNDEIKTYEGITMLLSYLRDRHYKVALASSADMIKVKANLTAAHIPLSFFDAVICGDMVENKKPAPDIFLKAADELQVISANCLVIEDALSGIQAAKAARMNCAAVMTSFGEKDFSPLQPDYIIEKTVDLKNIL